MECVCNVIGVCVKVTVFAYAILVYFRCFYCTFIVFYCILCAAALWRNKR